MTADGRPADAPLELGELRAVRSGDLLIVSLPGWLQLKCNQRSDVCALQISRELSRHWALLLGGSDVSSRSRARASCWKGHFLNWRCCWKL